MTDIEFTATFGRRKKAVQITRPFGAGDVYHLFIDKYFAGVMIKRDGVWDLHSPQPTQLAAEDILVLGEMIDQHFNK